MSYSFKNYDYGSYTGIVHSYIEELYNESFSYYNRAYGDIHPTGTKSLDCQKIIEFIGNVEDYLFYIYNVYNESFVDVFSAFNQKLSKVSVLPPNKRGLYGEFVERSSLLMISPVLSGSRNLTEKERTRLYVGHELGHIVNSYWVRDALNRMNVDDNSRIASGVDLLDEAITQNIAEDFAYCFADKDRSNLTYKKSLPCGRYSLFDGKAYKTNYDFYGELQEIAIMFAKTLRGIGKIDDDVDALSELCTRAFSHDFFKNIASEYIHDGQIDNLIYLLENMGIIKDASYAMFGYGDVEDIAQSGLVRDNIILMTNGLKDTRNQINLR